MIEIWLSKFYVEIDELCSDVYDSNDGTIQRSVLGPILCAIFCVLPVWFNGNFKFVDENFVIQFNANVNKLIVDLEMKLELIF
jgi:hypothetical protein